MSCKSECIGYVYAKHGAPVPNASIYLYSSKGSKTVEPNFRFAATTNSDGMFFFKINKKRGYSYWLKCDSDSGSAFGGYLDSKSNAINIQIQ